MPDDKLTDDIAPEVEAEITNSSVVVNGLKESTKSMRQHPKSISGLHLEGIEERNKDNLSSDTENASPAIGPKDISCVS